MSQVAEQPVFNGIPSNGHVVEPSAAGQQQSFDIVQILWRWKWLPILGSLIGAGLGYLYFSKQPAQYLAQALVQVATSLPSAARMEMYSPQDVLGTDSRADESMVIRSQKVLRLAVEKGQLTEQTEFAGQTRDQIVSYFMDEETPLVIEPAAKDDNTTLISISYVSTDAELASLVVNAIVEGYSEYLNGEYADVGDEIYNLVTEAQTKLQDRYKALNEQAMEFQKRNTNVIWTQDGAKDPYAENYLLLNDELSQLRIRRQKLRGTLEHVQSAEEAGRSVHSLLMMLVQSGNSRVDDYYFFRTDKENRQFLEKPDVGLRTDTRSAIMEVNDLLPLQMREQELLDTVGEGHPSIATIRKRIESLQQAIAQLRESERRLAMEEENIAREAFGEPEDIEGQTVEERYNIRKQSLIEELASLSLQERELAQLAAENQAKSNDLQQVLGSSRLLTSEVESTQTLLDAYTEKLNEVSLIPQAGQRTLNELNLPSIGAFYGPKLAPYLLGGAAVGFILLSGLAVLMDLADRSYRNPEEIAKDLGVTVLGHIPVMDISKVKKSIKEVDASVTSIHHSKGRVSEAYRSVRTGLYFSPGGQKLKVIQVTSPVPGDGKSTLSSNLAVSMAQSGRRVLLIDADFRRPRIAKIFGIDSEVGMATAIAGKAELEDAIHQGPVANLCVMPGGKRPNNPAELLSSQRFADMVDLLREKFDMIVIDTPPLLAVSDPGAVAGVVDGVVMTMRLRRNVKPLAMRATSILEAVGAKLLGVVVNGVSSEAGYGYNYDYNDYRYAYKYGSNYRSGYGYRYGYGNYRYGYSAGYDDDLSGAASTKNNDEA